ncbi:MAG TPA: hypothetical protein VF062_25735 [Candidatus Limnocylindrales bacterium]
MTEPRRPWHVPRRWDPHADLVPAREPHEAQETHQPAAEEQAQAETAEE